MNIDACLDGCSRMIQQKIAYCRDPALPFLEDKYHAKVLARIHGIPFVPLLFQCSDPRLFYAYLKKHMDVMPDFVVKTNHGCGDVCLVRRLGGGAWDVHNARLKASGSIDAISMALASFMRDRLREVHSSNEWAVNMVWPRRILVERLIETNDDYKVMVSGGKALFTYCNSGRFAQMGMASGVFDRDWNFVGALRKSIERHGKETAVELVRNSFPVPSNLLTLYDYCERLIPSRIDWQRVDFFRTEHGEFMLGEITAYSGGGGSVMALEADAERDLATRICDHPQESELCAASRVVRLPRDQGEDPRLESALRKAYLAVAMQGASIVVHADPDLRPEAVRELVRMQCRNPGKRIQTPLGWSWDSHCILQNIDRALLAAGDA
jgi:hypothetical protein